MLEVTQLSNVDPELFPDCLLVQHLFHVCTRIVI